MKLKIAKRKWEVFCGHSVQDAKYNFLKVLNDLNINYYYEETTGEKIQGFVLGTKKSNVLLFKNDSLEIKIIPVSGDPLYRAAMTMLGTSESKKLNNNLCLISITPFDNETKYLIQKIISKYVNVSKSMPWEINHPRFNISIGLNYKNKKSWMQLQ